MLDSWRESGYLLVVLSDALQEQVDAVYDVASAFFESPTDEKQACTHESEVYLGYLDRPQFDKELFQVSGLRVCIVCNCGLIEQAHRFAAHRATARVYGQHIRIVSKRQQKSSLAACTGSHMIS